MHVLDVSSESQCTPVLLAQDEASSLCGEPASEAKLQRLMPSNTAVLVM